MLNSMRLSRDEIIICFKEDVQRLLKFLPWLEKVSGGESSSIYSGEGIGEVSMAVPVYDATLLSFIKEIKATDFINRNYTYTFSRYNIKTVKDELRVIDACSLQEVSVLGDILSKYVLRGDVKGLVWTQGVSNGVYLAILLKLKDLMEIKEPLA